MKDKLGTITEETRHLKMEDVNGLHSDHVPMPTEPYFRDIKDKDGIIVFSEDTGSLVSSYPPWLSPHKEGRCCAFMRFYHFTVLAVVLWVGLPGAQPYTTVPTSLWPPEGGCVYEGKFYAEGETISEDSYKCYGIYCHQGLPVNWDAKCFFYTPPCDGWSEKVLGQCCPVCHSTSQTPTTTTTTSNPHVPELHSSSSTQYAPEHANCLHNGSIYEIGQSYWDDRTYPCLKCQCTDNSWSCNSVECRGEPGSASCASDSIPPGKCCLSCTGIGSQMFADTAVFCTAILVIILKYLN